MVTRVDSLGYTGTYEFPTGSSLASASTINLDTATGNRIHITGTTNINVVTLTKGPRTLIFDGVLTLNHNIVTNNLPSALSITTAVGDRAIFESDGTTVYCVDYVRASGLPVVSGLVVVLVSSTSVNAFANYQYVLTNVGATNVTLPASPLSGDTIWVTVTNGLTSNVILRNGNTIMGLSEDMTINNSNATVELRFLNSSWRLV